MSGEHVFLLDDVSESALETEIDGEVGKALRYRSPNIFLRQIDQLLIVRPLFFALQNSFLKVDSTCSRVTSVFSLADRP